MELIDRIQEDFYRSIELKKLVIATCALQIAAAAELLAECLSSQHKILTCGNGGSACDAQHFACELVNRFLTDRPNLPAISLTADAAVVTSIANDFGYEEVFVKQIRALGHAQDVLLAISTSGCSKNVVKAIQVAHEKNMNIIALTGGDGGIIKTILRDDDIEIRVPSEVTPRVQEVHVLIIHCLCDLVDHQLFGKSEEQI